MEYQIMRFSGEYLSKKINKLISLGMMYSYEDVITLSGTVYKFQVPFCEN